MKSVLKYFFFITILFVSFTLTSCNSNKTGCPVNESVHTKSGKDGKLSTKGGKSSLFPKNMKKKKRN